MRGYYFFCMTGMKVGVELTLLIESLAFGGEGVSRVELDPLPGTTKPRSLVVFVEDVVPEDKVLVRIVRKKRNFARAVVLKVLEPSRLRIQPRCRHFGMVERGSLQKIKGCGGCVWQFLEYAKQLEFKEQQVKDAMQRIGGVSPEIVRPILGGESWFYRNKMEFSFAMQPDGKLDLGLHMRHRHYDLVELTECFLLEPYVGSLVTFVRGFFQKLVVSGTLDPELTLQSFTVRQAKNTGQMMLIISAENGQENFMKEFSQAVRTFLQDQELTSLYFVHVHNKKGTPKRFEEKLIDGAATITETLALPQGKSLQFEISPLAFFQPNTKQAQLLYAKALEAAGLTGKEIVFDLFCGTGTIGLFCAGQAGKVYGIELNASAIENARQNAALNHITNVEFFVGDVQKMLETLPTNPDVVIVDPPRNGLAPKTIDTISEMKPKRLVYVSCNPTSLARDAALFAKTGYQLQSVQPVDMFPQTYHIENVALFIAS